MFITLTFRKIKLTPQNFCEKILLNISITLIILIITSLSFLLQDYVVYKRIIETVFKILVLLVQRV